MRFISTDLFSFNFQINPYKFRKRLFFSVLINILAKLSILDNLLSYCIRSHLVMEVNKTIGMIDLTTAK